MRVESSAKAPLRLALRVELCRETHTTWVLPIGSAGDWRWLCDDRRLRLLTPLRRLLAYFIVLDREADQLLHVCGVRRTQAASHRKFQAVDEKGDDIRLGGIGVQALCETILSLQEEASAPPTPSPWSWLYRLDDRRITSGLPLK